MNAPTPPRLIHWLGTSSLGVIWGTAFLGMALALEGFGPLWVATGRLLIGGATLFAADRLWRRTLPDTGPTPWGIVTLIGMFSTAFPFLLLSWGLQFVPSAFAGVSMAAVALFVMPMAHLFVSERMTLKRTAGVLTGFAGVVVLFGPEALAGTGDRAVMSGQAACLGAALCYAASSILTRRCPPMDPIRLTLLSTLAGAAILVPLALWREGMPPLVPERPLIALVLLGIFPTGLAFLARTMIVRSAGPNFMSLTAYQVPVWAVIFGFVFMSEPIPPQMLIALGMILGGIAISQIKRPPAWLWTRLRR